MRIPPKPPEAWIRPPRRVSVRQFLKTLYTSGIRMESRDGFVLQARLCMHALAAQRFSRPWVCLPRRWSGLYQRDVSFLISWLLSDAQTQFVFKKKKKVLFCFEACSRSSFDLQFGSTLKKRVLDLELLFKWRFWRFNDLKVFGKDNMMWEIKPYLDPFIKN